MGLLACAEYTPISFERTIQHWYGRLVGWLESWEPSELPQNTFIYDVSLKSLSPPQSHGLSDDTVEWQMTCEALEAKVNAKTSPRPERPPDLGVPLMCGADTPARARRSASSRQKTSP
jgi:hypothetical protein